MSTAVFVPAYCCKYDSGGVVRVKGLTEMSRQSVLVTAELVKKGHAKYVILSTAYSWWHDEAEMKMELLSRFGIDPNIVRIIPKVHNTYDETAGARQFIDELSINTIIVVADKWHEPRATQTFRSLFPTLTILGSAFETPRYQMTMEESFIKSVRAGWKPLWIVWNVLFSVLTPLFVSRR